MLTTRGLACAIVLTLVDSSAPAPVAQNTSQHRRDPRGRHGMVRHRLLWRRDSDAAPRCARGGRRPLHAVLQHAALLADARQPADRPLLASGRNGTSRHVVRRGSLGTTGRLNDRSVTIAEVLRDAGYFTAMSGKWHLGQQNGSPPWQRGFDRVLNLRAGRHVLSQPELPPAAAKLTRRGQEPLYLDGTSDRRAIGDVLGRTGTPRSSGRTGG